MTDSTSGFLTSAQAAARLGVKPATLYAYVSRGLLERHPGPDGRTSLFDPADLRRLERRSSVRRSSPSEVVVSSELTLVDAKRGRLWFRGLDPLDACRLRRFEEIAGWLWTGNFEGPAAWRADPRSKRAGDRAQAAIGRTSTNADRLPLIAAAVAGVHASQPAKTGLAAATDLMSCLVDCLPGASAPAGSHLAARLWPKLTTRAPSETLVRILDAALSVTCEHGLTSPALVARLCAAHGGTIASAVASAYGCAVSATHLTSAEPESSPDPRAVVLLQMLDEAATGGSGPPTATSALETLASAGGMRPGSAHAIALVASAAGWIAHALEEHRQPTPFRPRLAYTGPAPRSSTPRRMLDAVQDYPSRE